MIMTYTGRLIDPLWPDPSQIAIEDIAHALSCQGRFTGHTRKFYSVAEHSVRCSWLASPAHKLHALLHDASEAYLSDIASPVKQSPEFSYYRKVEAALQAAVRERFGLGDSIPNDVHIADRYMLGIEARDLMPGGNGKAHQVGDVRVPFYWAHAMMPIIHHPMRIRRPWSPRKAERMFLREYRKLEKQRG